MKADLQTAGEVIDALGGTSATAKIASRSSQAVSNWRERGQLPAETFLVISNALGERGLHAPPKIWGITQPESAAS